MQHDTTPRITRFTDPDGTPCVRVLLSDHQTTAELYAEDYEWLIEQGVTGRWRFVTPNQNAQKYVQCNTSIPYHATLTVARLLTLAEQGQQVRYLDGNTLNLRLDNLRCADGGAQ